MHAITLNAGCRVATSSFGKGVHMPKFLLINLMAICFTVLSSLMFSFGSEVEQREITRVVKHHMQSGPSQLSAAEGNKEIEIIRDRFLIFIILGSGLAGASTYVGLRLMYMWGTLKTVERFHYLSLGSGFFVSILTALFLSPGMIKLVLKNNGPEEVAAFTFLFAAVSTTMWDIAMAIGKRWIMAAEKGGVSGLRAEITQGSPVPPAPNMPEQNKV